MSYSPAEMLPPARDGDVFILRNILHRLARRRRCEDPAERQEGHRLLCCCRRNHGGMATVMGRLLGRLYDWDMAKVGGVFRSI